MSEDINNCSVFRTMFLISQPIFILFADGEVVIFCYAIMNPMGRYYNFLKEFQSLISYLIIPIALWQQNMPHRNYEF